MKKLIYYILILPSLLLAQAPQGFAYQAVATDNNGLELVEQYVSVRVSILSESSTGVVQWIETHSTITDGFGLFTITIGEGTSTGNGVQSSFSDIDWGASEHHLKIEMDVNGGSNYQLLGISQLMSVPYALYAENTGVDSILNALQETVNQFPDINELEQLSIQIDSLNMILNNSNDFITHQINLNDTISLNVTPNRSVVMTGSMHAYNIGCGLQLRITDSNLVPIQPELMKGGGWVQWNGDASYSDFHSPLYSLPYATGDDDARNVYYSVEFSQSMQVYLYFEMVGNPYYGASSCGGSANVKIQY